MTIQEFFDKYNGKFVEVAGSPDAKFQCVDLANAYIKEVLGLPIIEWTNAVDFPQKAGDKYDYILNTPTGIPQLGDLVIWGGNQYGHIAVFKEGNANKFTSFDQNYPIGTSSHFQNHDYKNVLGWLRAKPQELMVTLPQKELDQIRIRRDELYNDNQKLLEIIKQKEEEAGEWKTKYEDEQKHTTNLNEQIANANALMEKIKNEDYEYGLKTAALEKEVIELKSDFKSIADVLSVKPDVKDILRALDELKQPSDEVAKEYLKLAKALENFFYTRVPKAKPFIVKLFVKIIDKVR